MSIPATGPMPKNCPRLCRACGALLDRNQIVRDSVTLVLDKGSAALANTLELEKARVGWISALPWNQAPAELRDRSVEQLPACGSSQPGVRAAAEKLFVHGKEYLCVLKYSACFASEQLNSTTAALTRVTQKLRRLATELSRPQARFTEQGIRNKIHRWLLDPFVREVLHYGLEQRENRWHLTFEVDNKALQQLVVATSRPYRAAHQPYGLDRRTGRVRLLRPAADRTCLPRIKGRRLAGLGTDVPLDRQQDPRACFLLHVGNLAAPTCSPPGPERLARISPWNNCWNNSLRCSSSLCCILRSATKAPIASPLFSPNRLLYSKPSLIPSASTNSVVPNVGNTSTRH